MYPVPSKTCEPLAAVCADPGGEVSFAPVMTGHHLDGSTAMLAWEDTTNTVLLVFFVGSIVNLVLKIFVQWIAMTFHIRTYQDRLSTNKAQIKGLIRLYHHAVETHRNLGNRIDTPSKRSPGKALAHASKLVAAKLTDAVGHVRHDFAGKQLKPSSSPHQRVNSDLQSQSKAKEVCVSSIVCFRCPEGGQGGILFK